ARDRPPGEGRRGGDQSAARVSALATALIDSSVIGSRTSIASSAPASARSRRCSASAPAATGGESGSRGRSPAPPSTATSTQALRRTVAATRALRVAYPAAVFPYQAYQAFHVVTCGSVISRSRGPAVPIMIGSLRAGGGRRTASSTR